MNATNDTELPHGWALIRLSDVANMRLGKMLDAAKNVGSLTAYLRNVNVRWFSFDLRDLFDMRATPQDRTEFSIEDGDLLVCEGGEPGRCAVWELGPTDLIFQKAIHRIRPSCGVSPKWLALSIKRDAESGRLEEYFTGSGIKHLTGKSLATYSFPLPPLPEQQRIIAKVEEVLNQANRSRERLAKVPKILKAFRQSVLAAACSGRLTEDWRESNRLNAPDSPSHLEDEAADTSLLPPDNSLPDSWAISTVAKIVSKVEAGKNIRCEERPPNAEEVGIVKISSVTWGEFDENESKTLIERGLFLPERQINRGDLLISRANTIDLVGACVIVGTVRRTLMLSDKILRLCVTDSDLKVWLLFWLRSRLGRFQIENAATGNQLSMRNISQENLKRLVIAVPPRREQREIVRRVEILFKLADKIEKRVESATKRADRLTQSVLAKAFRGELVPNEAELARREGRDYEPASVLLDRIKAQREIAAGSRNGHRRGS
jgi:type I restriction enzyme S subunit